MLFKHPALTICLSLLFIQGCSDNSSILAKDNLPLVYTIDVQQGNVITQEMLAKLKFGMNKKKVRFVMGTPLITDTFHSDRWDYVYTFKEGRNQREQRRVTLFFEDELLARIEGDVVAARGEIQTDSRVVESVEVPPADQPGLFARVKEKLTFGSDKPKIEEKLDDEIVDAVEDDIEELEAETEIEEPESEMMPEEMTNSDKEMEMSEEADQNSEEEEKGFFGSMWEKLSGGGDDEEEVAP